MDGKTHDNNDIAPDDACNCCIVSTPAQRTKGCNTIAPCLLQFKHLLFPRPERSLARLHWIKRCRVSWKSR